MISIITARGGSKGLPGKNILLLDNIPLIAYSIKAALNSKYIDRVIVNTDDVEIAEISKIWGAEVPFIRPSELGEDGSTTFDVLKHCLDWFKDNENLDIKELVLLQPTSPLRNEQHIDDCIEVFLDNSADSVISCVKSEHPIFWNKYINEDGTFEDVFESDSFRRQEYKDTYLPNGAVYVLKSDLIAKGTMYSSKTYSYIMNSLTSVDIDTQIDLEYAQFLIHRQNA